MYAARKHGQRSLAVEVEGADLLAELEDQREDGIAVHNVQQTVEGGGGGAAREGAVTAKVWVSVGASRCSNRATSRWGGHSARRQAVVVCSVGEERACKRKRTQQCARASAL